MIRRLRTKTVVVLGLSLLMVAGTGTAAFAKGPGKGGWGNGRFQNENINFNFNFKDIQNKQWDWAARYIADLASRQVFEGYNDGTFRPQDTVTRIEAITAAVRVMGLKDQAESSAEMQTHLNFKDANQIPSWAVGYVAVALENNLFSETDTAVNPNQPADRLWATTLLVKALKLESEAESKMNVQLSFADADKIPAGSVGYVSVAVEKGLINGFEDNTFRPNQPVTRAQIAALLDRAGDQLPDSNDGLVTGTVSTPLNNNVLTINSNGQTVNLTLDPNVFVFRGGGRVDASALQVGDVVRTRTLNNDTIYVEVTQPAAGTQTTTANGLVTGTLLAPVTNNVMALSSGGQTLSPALNSGAFIYRNGVQVSASALQAGDVVNTRIYNNAVVFIDVTQPAGSASSSSSYEGSISGTVAAIPSNNALTLTSAGQTVSVPLNANAFVYRNGALTDVSALQIGDTVTAYTFNGAGVIVEVTTPASTQSTGADTTTSGTVETPVSNNVLTLLSGGQSVSLTLNANAFIYRNGVQAGASSLQVGDIVTAHSYNGAVVSAEVTQPAGSAATQTVNVNNYTGTVVSPVTGNSLTLLNNGQTTTLALDSGAFVYRNGVQVSISALQAGDVVTTRSYNNIVVFVDVTQPAGAAQNGSFTADGTFSGMTMNSQGQIATVTITQIESNGSVSTNVFNVSSSVTISGNLSQLVTGHNVILQGSNSLVTSITIS